MGFVTRGAPSPPVRSHSVLTDACPTSPAPDISLSGSSLSPVMIPPPRHNSADGLPSLALSAASPLPVSTSPLRRDTIKISMGSYNTSEFFLSSSPTMSPSSQLDADSELSDEFEDVSLGLGSPRPGPSDQLLPRDPHRPPSIPAPLSASHLSARVRSRDLLRWLGIEGCGGLGAGERDWWGDDGQREEKGERERGRRDETKVWEGWSSSSLASGGRGAGSAEERRGWVKQRELGFS